MKTKRWIPAVIVGVALLVGQAAPSYSWNGRYDHGPKKVVVVNKGYGQYHHNDNNGWETAAIIAGGLALGAVIAAAFTPPPQPVAPAPVYGYPGSYSYSEPAYAPQEPPGVWRTVPGQWVNGRWVPSHQVWVPVNPY